jgi:hypothetical protein
VNDRIPITKALKYLVFSLGDGLSNRLIGRLELLERTVYSGVDELKLGANESTQLLHGTVVLGDVSNSMPGVRVLANEIILSLYGLEDRREVSAKALSRSKQSCG